MGFGHRVYKNYDPRAKIMQQTCHRVLKEVGHENDPLLQVAMELEQIALKDPTSSRRSSTRTSITIRASRACDGLPDLDVHGAVRCRRTVGWIAQWSELFQDPDQRIGRPRQIYAGAPRRDYVSVDKRK